MFKKKHNNRRNSKVTFLQKNEKVFFGEFYLFFVNVLITK